MFTEFKIYHGGKMLYKPIFAKKKLGKAFGSKKKSCRK